MLMALVYIIILILQFSIVLIYWWLMKLLLPTRVDQKVSRLVPPSAQQFC